MRFQRLLQVVFLLAALDSVAYGLWACFWPENLFTLLELPPREPIAWQLMGVKLTTTDHILLWRCLGVCFLAHALILILAGWRPRAWGSLVVVPLIGRALMLGVWLWLLGTECVALAALPLRVLAAHDGLWVAIMAAILIVWSYGGMFSREPPASANPALARGSRLNDGDLTRARQDL